MNSRLSPEQRSRTKNDAQSGRPQPKQPPTSSTPGDLLSDATSAAKSAGRSVKEQATQLGKDVGEELQKSASVQKERGAEALHDFARAIERAADELEGQSPAVAGYIRDTAEKFRTLSANVSGKDVPELMKAVSDLARQYPAVFFGGALALGFGLTRFLKAGSAAHGSDAGDFHGS